MRAGTVEIFLSQNIDIPSTRSPKPRDIRLSQIIDIAEQSSGCICIIMVMKFVHAATRCYLVFCLVAKF